MRVLLTLSLDVEPLPSPHRLPPLLSKDMYMAQECRMGDLEKTFLSKEVFPEIGELRFSNEVRFFNVTRISMCRTALLSRTDP